ncbi:MAG TPA: murein L,D-transpeptidase catalytic domain family protein [Puia sp.]|nr:murein L,D-transpeptidase catalytic domain family protein [Puia sp.]
MCRILLIPVWLVLLAAVAPVNVLKANGGGGGAKVRKHVVSSSRMSARVSARASAFAAEAAALYDEIDLKEIGLSKKTFEYALRGYHYMMDHHWIGKPNIISICDLSQSSRNKRLYVLDLDQKMVLVNTYVAHGRNSGLEYARSFSNNPSSHKTSLGFYITQDTYFGANGLSLKIKGLERGFNDKACGRNIVVHGSEYVGPDFLQMNGVSGRSYGCPAIPADETEEIIDLIKDGTCLFIYHPTKRYISRSKILND